MISLLNLAMMVAYGGLFVEGELGWYRDGIPLVPIWSEGFFDFGKIIKDVSKFHCSAISYVMLLNSSFETAIDTLLFDNT